MKNEEHSHTCVYIAAYYIIQIWSKVFIEEHLSMVTRYAFREKYVPWDMAFHIVQFDDGLALVPTNWLSTNQTSCFYPMGYTNRKKLHQAIANAENPKINNKSANWVLHDVKRYFSSAVDPKIRT
ncbi:uncharacterized protein LOC114932804 isoform X2 [Nylanderia fulva]|uniref:uncharacterized protein LOC114932804 isoform X2 n=1 Tax=Nylanderia fulva TaxID=613905 RepID=UPI0010FB1906|nr:uncharacterized protein LOC114932804 isoform X2 [Nylanderia fulva]